MKNPSFLQLTFVTFSLPLPVNSLLQLTNKSICSFSIRKIPCSAKNASFHYQINSCFLLTAQSIISACPRQQTGHWKETCLGSFSPIIWHATCTWLACQALLEHMNVANSQNNAVEDWIFKTTERSELS